MWRWLPNVFLSITKFCQSPFQFIYKSLYKFNEKFMESRSIVIRYHFYNSCYFLSVLMTNLIMIFKNKRGKIHKICSVMVGYTVHVQIFTYKKKWWLNSAFDKSPFLCNVNNEKNVNFYVNILRKLLLIMFFIVLI